MSRDRAALLGVIGGTPRRSSDQAATPQIGVVKSVSPAGVLFTMPDYDGGRHDFGPAPWHRGGPAPATPASDGDTAHTHGAHGHDPAGPWPGASCLVVFVGSGVARPVVVAWW